ncbi:dynein heavy chain, cytoplasmic-like [Pecten maximus]|uniref:dynein heavy chain, cytoplasmic-like n=1 Tax=Pecten maximus TaxID=6579 RepID=UPI001458BB01|nr:dynein heavy chain, cytoplasmic-like [Pecten maximus]
MAKVTQQELGELKSLAAPPQIIKDVLAAVMILIGEPNPREYKTAQKVLSQRSYDNSMIERLSTLDVGTIPMEEVVKAQGLVDGITIENVQKVSLAACGIFSWLQDVLSRVGERTGNLNKT